MKYVVVCTFTLILSHQIFLEDYIFPFEKDLETSNGRNVQSIMHNMLFLRIYSNI